MSEPIYYDTETCGFHGPIVLIQYAIGDGEIILHCPWKFPIYETIELIEMMMNYEGGVVGFNLAFDHFHLCQMYTTLILMKDWDAILGDCMEEYALNEPEARYGPALKPYKAHDIMMHARKGEYQSTMDRGDVRIKRIPTALAWELARELDQRIPLKDVYFARKKDSKERWKVFDIKEENGDINTDFKDIVLKFAPSSALKALAEDIFNIEKAVLFGEVDVSERYRPVEQGWAPFALAPFTEKTSSGKRTRRQPSPKNWYGKWPQVISYHITHWGYNSRARKYASDDVVYTRKLYKHFGSPEMDDDDSVLCCMVGAVRWRGYAIDVNMITEQKTEAEILIKSAPHNFNSSDVCKEYLLEVMTDIEALSLMVDDKVTTKGIILEHVSKWGKEEICESCEGMGCDECEDGLIMVDEGSHEAAKRAKQILEFRHAKKEIENFTKLLDAGRFHASFKVIGTLSSRMAGGDGLNAQGIKHAKKVRQCFPLADKGLSLTGGDFSGFEVCLADAAYGDPALREDLLSGKKIHALFGQFLFPPMTYEEILATDGLGGELDKYTRSKQGVFALLYGGEGYTLSTRVGVPEETANKAYQRWCEKYIVFGEERKKTFDAFCSMRQPEGIGSRVEWHEPAEFVESMFGFKRYFTLENMICKTLFQLAESPPKAWQQINFKVVRRDREQTACGALRSALFASSFAVQASNMRAAGNHRIQSSGATMTKKLQRRIWDVQPAGISAWRVQPMNIHDEVMAPCLPEVKDSVIKVVDTFVEEHKSQVPLLKIDWTRNLKTWADK